MSTRVTLIRDGELVDTLCFEKPLIRIGRAPRAADGPIDVVLPSDRVSGLHAQLIVSDLGLTLIDRSRNGTFVNGELLRAPRQLAAGDDVEIDVFTLRCALADGAEDDANDDTPTTSPPPAAPALERRSAPEQALEFAPPDDDLPDFDLDHIGAQVPKDISIGASPPQRPPSADRPKPPPAETPRREETEPGGARSPLAGLYRELAAQLGAADWGRPPLLTASALPRALEAARRAVTEVGIAPPERDLWGEWLGRELCGLDPIHSLLADPTVTRLIVHGDHSIAAYRGATAELAPIRFSCVEALHAAIERWTGRPLRDAPIEQITRGVAMHAFPRGLAPSGPLVVVRRAARQPRSLDELTRELALSPAAAALLRGCLARARGLLLYGDADVDPTALLHALRRELPPTATVAVLQRASTWPPELALVLDGHQDRGVLWSCVERLGADWLIVEELGAADLLRLVELGRHGGAIATLRAGSGEAALARLSALLGHSSGRDMNHCRAALSGAIELFVGLRSRGEGGARVASISELRPRGELAELFRVGAGGGALEPTGVDPHILT